MKWTDVADYGLDDTDMSVVRCKPEGIDELSRVTSFSRKELQTMYRGFKQVRVASSLLTRGSEIFSDKIAFSVLGFRIFHHSAALLDSPTLN